MKLHTLCVLLAAMTLFGCDSSTPQASEDVKKQMMGRKPTAEELAKAAGNASARAAEASSKAQGK